MRAWGGVLLLALTRVAVADEAATLRVFFDVGPASRGGAPITTGVYRPREGEPCTLTVRLRNDGDDPVVMVKLEIIAQGIFKQTNPLANHRPELFHAGEVFADEVSAVDRGLTATYHWMRFGDSYSGKPADCLYGDHSTPYRRVSEGGILTRGQSTTYQYPWIPVMPDGSTSVGVEATAMMLTWSPAFVDQVFFLDRSLPEPPEWVKQNIPADKQPRSSVRVSYRAARSWDDKTDFRDALLDKTMRSKPVEIKASRRFTLAPGKPPLENLVAQRGGPINEAVYSPALEAWFLPAGDRVQIIGLGKKLELSSGVTDFVTSRAIKGRDGDPWRVSDPPPSFYPYVSGHPVDESSGTKAYLVPVNALLDRLSDLERLGLLITETGSILEPAPAKR